MQPRLRNKISKLAKKKKMKIEKVLYCAGKPLECLYFPRRADIKQEFRWPWVKIWGPTTDFYLLFSQLGIIVHVGMREIIYKSIHRNYIKSSLRGFLHEKKGTLHQPQLCAEVFHNYCVLINLEFRWGQKPLKATFNLHLPLKITEWIPGNNLFYSWEVCSGVDRQERA